MDYKQIAALISGSRKTTPAKVYIKGRFKSADFEGCGFQSFGGEGFWILIGDYTAIRKWMGRRRGRIEDQHFEIIARHSALPLLDLQKIEARIEPGAIIRTGATIGKGCVIMMGAVINIGASVGQETMVDMNAVLGARAIVGRRCHIGAGAVIAGVLEPPSKKPVVIGDDVLVGANAVVLEGVRIGRGSVVGAGAIVTKNVPPGVVVAGAPARIIKTAGTVSVKTKTAIVKKLRKLPSASKFSRKKSPSKR